MKRKFKKIETFFRQPSLLQFSFSRVVLITRRSGSSRRVCDTVVVRDEKSGKSSDGEPESVRLRARPLPKLQHKQLPVVSEWLRAASGLVQAVYRATFPSVGALARPGLPISTATSATTDSRARQGWRTDRSFANTVSFGELPVVVSTTRETVMLRR